MRNKLFILFIFTLCSFEAIAQRSGINWPKGYYINGPLFLSYGNDRWGDTNVIVQMGRDTSLKGALFPRGVVANMVNPLLQRGVFMYNYNDSVLYHVDGTRLVRYITAKDTAAMLQAYTRVSRFLDSLSSHRASLVHYQDTAAMLSAYTRVNRFLDSIAAHRAQMVKYQDTSAMLLPYVEWNDTNGQGQIATVTDVANAGTVRSIGLTLSTSGTDVGVSGSPVTTTGIITLSIPSASATARGLLTTGTQTLGGDKTLLAKWTVQTTTTPQRRLAYDGSNLLDESIASNGAITYNLQGSAPTYTYQINGVTKVFIAGTGQTTWTTTSEMIAQFGNTQTDKVFLISGTGGQFASGWSGIMFGSSFAASNPSIAVRTSLGAGNLEMSIANVNIFRIATSRFEGNVHATNSWVGYTLSHANIATTGNGTLLLVSNNQLSGQAFSPVSGSNTYVGVGSEMRVRATLTWAGLAMAYNVGQDAGNTYANGTAVGYNYDLAIGIAFRNSNAGARNLFMGKVSIGSATAPTDQLELTGNFALMVAGNKIKIPTGTNAAAGTFTLSSGTATVNTTAVSANSIIEIKIKTAGGTTVGVQYPYTISAGTSFTVTSIKTDKSTETNDNSTLSYIIYN